MSFELHGATRRENMLKENIYGWGNPNLCCMFEFLWGQDLDSKLPMKLFYWHHMVLKWNPLLFAFLAISFLIRWWFKARLCVRDLISSEPALPPGEHPRSDRAIIFSSIGGCHQLCWNVGLCLCASSSLSFATTFIYSFSSGSSVHKIFLSWSDLCFYLPPTPLWTHSEELFFLKPLDKRNLFRHVILMEVN